MARRMACQLATGSLPSTTSPGMPNALPRSMMCRSPCWLHAGVEMPQPLFVTMISTGSSLPGPRAPDQAGGEIALGRAGVAAGDDGDAVAAVALLHQGRARRHGVLHLDDRGDRHDVPVAAGEVAGEIAAHRVRVGGGHGHLADAVDQRHAHGHQRGAVAIVEVEVIVSGAAALLDLQAEAGVERFLAGAADPEVALARLAHLDHPLFHGAGPHHDAVDLQAALGRQRLVAAGDLREARATMPFASRRSPGVAMPRLPEVGIVRLPAASDASLPAHECHG